MECLCMLFSLSNKSDGKGFQKIKPINVMSNDEFDKKSNGARKKEKAMLSIMILQLRCIPLTLTMLYICLYCVY